MSEHTETHCSTPRCTKLIEKNYIEAEYRTTLLQREFTYPLGKSSADRDIKVGLKPENMLRCVPTYKGVLRYTVMGQRHILLPVFPQK